MELSNVRVLHKMTLVTKKSYSRTKMLVHCCDKKKVAAVMSLQKGQTLIWQMCLDGVGAAGG